MTDSMLKRLCTSLINVGLKSQELKKEIMRYNKHKSLYSCFSGRVRFNFANYNFTMLVESEDPASITAKNVTEYELRDRKNNTILATASA